MNKKIIYTILTLSSLILKSEPFKFISYKENNALSSSFLEKLAIQVEADVFFETGTYAGDTTAQAAAAGVFHEIHTCELSEKMAKAARQRFAKNSNIFVYHGHSPEIFNEILPSIQGNILFWLDAHFCGEGTAKSNETEAGDTITAIRKELDAIQKNNVKNCTILIDDIRGFGTKIGSQEFKGCWAYPSVQEVCVKLKEINPNFSFALLDKLQN